MNEMTEAWKLAALTDKIIEELDKSESFASQQRTYVRWRKVTMDFSSPDLPTPS